jgi:hypothetical protein
MLNMEWVAGDYRTDHSTSLLSIAWWNIEHEQGQNLPKFEHTDTTQSGLGGQFLIFTFVMHSCRPAIR